MTQTRKSELQKQAAELSATWVLIETNEGTYGSADARNATGSGDPKTNDYRVYEQVGTGYRRTEGCGPSVAPGYPRRFSKDLTAKHQELRRLRAEIETL